MKFTFNSSSDSSRVERKASIVPLVRPPGSNMLGSSVTGPVASASGGGTVIGATIPVAYGYNKLKGYLAFTRRVQEELYLAWVYTSGKVNFPGGANIFFNGESCASQPVAGAVFDANNGGASQSVNAWLSGLGSQFAFSYPGQAMVFAYFEDTRYADLGSLNLEVITDGRLFKDFRTPSAAEAHITNPVSIAWDVLTSSWPWPGVLDDTASSSNIDIDYDQWAEWADWCDETSVRQYDYVSESWDSYVTLTGQKRWTFNGIVKETNAYRAANSVLANSFLKIVHSDGKLRLRAETDTAPTSVYIPEGRFFGVPTITDTDPGLVPTEMKVGFISKEDFSSCSVLYTVPSAAGEHSPLGLMLYGTNTQKQAVRWAEQKALLLQERLTVKMVCGPEVANVASGDIIKSFLPYGFGDSFVRVMSIIGKQDLGKYEISGRIIPGSVVSVDDTNEYVAQTNDGGWETGTPEICGSFSCVADSVKTSNDTYQPVIDALWTPPLSGPRPRYYELKQEGTIVARVFGLKWSGPVLSGGSAVDFTIAAVGFNGQEGPTRLVTRNLDIGYVSGIGGTDLADAASEDGSTIIYDINDDTFRMVKHYATHEYHTLTVPGTVDNAGDLINDLTNVVRAISATPKTDSANNPVDFTVSFSGPVFSIKHPNGATGYDIDYYCLVSLTPKSTSGTDSGVPLPGGEAS